MAYLSDVNLRALLTVLLERAGGEIHVSNDELYGAMMPEDGRAEPFVVDDTTEGVRVSLKRRGTDPAGRG